MAGLLPTNENERNYLEEIKAALARSGQETPQQGSYQPISRSDYPLRDRGKMGLMSEVPPVIEAMGRAGLPITLRGTKEGVGLYAGDETEPIHRTTPEGKTEPYYAASAPPPPPPPPAPEVNTVERVNADYKQRQEAYLEAKRNQAAIIQKGYQLGYSSQKIEEVLKTKGLHKVTEPKHSSWEEEILKSDLKRQEEERKEQKKKEESEPLGFGDKELIKKTLIEMPKLKREAVVAKNISTQIDTAHNLMVKGVTGKGGQLKSFLAPYAEMVGINTENLSDSQKFQLLTRAIIGPMRLEIVGPGPVSEWEQKLMQQISGGGGAAKEAATELLGHWQKLAQSKIDNYNDTLMGFSEVYPNVQKVYQPLTTGKEKVKEEETTNIPEGATPTGKTSGGKPVYQMPDGRYWVQ